METNGYRSAACAIPGFNLAVVDIDAGINISAAKLLMEEYTYILHTTKRHTESANRFRMIFPLSHEVVLDAKDFKQFMQNFISWLPFDVDEQTCDIARKWLTNSASEIYENQGKLINALLFIPKTKKAEKQATIIRNQQHMNNLERWFLNNTEEGSRSNQLIKYSFILVDNRYDFDTVRDKVLALNNKLEDKLSESEILSTIMVTVAKKIAKRDS